MGITWIFLIGDILMTGRLLFIGAAAVYDRLQEKIFGRPAEVASYKPKVAVLIPAYNEEKVIERTVRAALNSDYRNLRVIVIDDGSGTALSKLLAAPSPGKRLRERSLSSPSRTRARPTL